MEARSVQRKTAETWEGERHDDLWEDEIGQKGKTCSVFGDPYLVSHLPIWYPIPLSGISSRIGGTTTLTNNHQSGILHSLIFVLFKYHDKGHYTFLCSHWYPCWGLMASILGLKIGMDLLACVFRGLCATVDSSESSLVRHLLFSCQPA